MKIIAFITFLSGLIISVNSLASWSFSLDDRNWSDRSNYNSGTDSSPQQLRIVQFHDFYNYYLYIELAGIKPEEVDIQRQGSRITIRQVRGRMEESESQDVYRSFQSYSSFTRGLTLPPDADPDVSKMERKNHENFVRLTIPKQVYQP